MLDGAAVRRLARSLRRLARTRYPPFLLGRGVAPGEIPIFTYHEVEAAALCEDLDFLERNGYRTVGLDEFHERSQRGAEATAGCVLLAFDDARRNFWEVAFPVLKSRGACAALFAPSYWIGNGGGGETGIGSPPGFMTWSQLSACEHSGLIDVESHAHRHALVAASDRLVGFASPRTLARHDLFDWPMRCERGEDVCGRPPPGTPVYESVPLLSARTRFIEPPLAAEACRVAVAAGGGVRFFDRPRADAELRRVHAAAARRAPGARLTEHELGEQLDAELGLAVESFRSALGRAPRYFAYPWMLGSSRSLERLAELGFAAAFGVALDFARARRARAPLPVYARYKCEWLRFLPGRGRRCLRDVVPSKLKGFLSAQHLAH